MKKLSLKNAESMLSRKEMKAINGGYYSSGSGMSYDYCTLWCSSQPYSIGCTYKSPTGGWYCEVSRSIW